MKIIGTIINKYGVLPVILALVSSSLTFIVKRTLISDSNTINDIFGGLAIAIITFLITANFKTLEKVHNQLQEADINKVSNIRNHIDKDFLGMFDDYFDSVINNLNSAVKDKTITIHSTEQFRDFYIRVLNKHPDTTFYATSILDKDYFWPEKIEEPKKGTVEYATQEFTANAKRGISKKKTFERIFFISDHNKEDLDRMKEVFALHEKMGVETYCIEVDDLGIDQKRLEKFILVTKNKKFAWEVHVQNRKISSVDITVNSDTAEEYWKIYKAIEKKGLTKADKYLKDLQESK